MVTINPTPFMCKRAKEDLEMRTRPILYILSRINELKKPIIMYDPTTGKTTMSFESDTYLEAREKEFINYYNEQVETVKHNLYSGKY